MKRAKKLVRTVAQRALNAARKNTPAQRAKRRAAAELNSIPALPPGQARIGVYYAGDTTDLYQLRQWYGPLRDLSRAWSILFITREPAPALAAHRESGLDAAYAETVIDLEELVDNQPLDLILYVNQHPLNFEMLRHTDRRHVYINHGESDKMFMTTNQFKAYDIALVAGDAARVRLARALWDYDVDARTIAIGRPQTDHLEGEAPYPDDDRMVVLYAPTWEGDRPSALYGSVISHGEALVHRLIATGKHRVIYRPHPRSGAHDPAYRAASDRIAAALAAANHRDPAARHIYDESPDIGWQVSEPDIAILDVSAMIYDRLATGKPLIVTRPVAVDAEVDETGYLSACEWLRADEVDQAVARLDAAIDDKAARERLGEWTRHYFGDTAQGEPTRRFTEAIAALLADVERRRLGA